MTRRYTRLIAPILALALLFPATLQAQSVKRLPAEPEVITPDDEAQDAQETQMQKEKSPDDSNIIATRPDAQSMWEFMNQYNGPDRLSRFLNIFANGKFVTRNGYGCSGAMISPHIFMTAAHCGGPEWTGFVRFFHIDEDAASPGNAAQGNSELYYATAFPWQEFTGNNGQHSDIVLYWVEDGEGGVPPGVKYGYLELSTDAPKEEDRAYSYWVNSVSNFNGQNLNDTLLHSSGTVTGVQSPLANFSTYGNMYAAFGASGSAIISAKDHKVIGVTSGCIPCDAPRGIFEGVGRTAADTIYLLNMNDADRNNVLDAIEYDFLYTRAPRSFYRLLFNSPLHQALWRLGGNQGAGTTANDQGIWGKVVGNSRDQRSDGLWHSAARFTRNATYRISLLAYGISSDGSDPYIRFVSDRANSEIMLPFRPQANAWKRFSFRVTLGNNADYRLILGEQFGGEYRVQDVAITREDARFDFGSDDERRAWEYLDRSHVTSWGINGVGDFSGKVVNSSGNPPTNPGSTWGLRNRYVALRVGKTYEIKFDVQSVSFQRPDSCYMRVEDLSGVAITARSWFFASNGQTIRDLTATVTINNGNQGYLVDNVRIREL